MNLIVALPYCTADAPAALRLLNWIKELDEHQNYHLLLVADDAVSMAIKQDLNAVGKTIFSSVETIMPKCPSPISQNYHPAAAAMFLKTISHIDTVHKWDFLWLEPDCVPLKVGWLDALASAYEKCPKRFMGAVTPLKQDGLPPVVMFGTAIYPNCAHAELKQFCDGKQAFDMAFSNYVVPRAQNTPLIQHVFGAPNDPPRFKEEKGPGDGPNVGTLASVRGDAVLWHRNKDGSLIDLLRKKFKEHGWELPPKYDPNIIKEEPAFDPQIPPADLVKRGPGRPPKQQTQTAPMI